MLVALLAPASGADESESVGDLVSEARPIR